MATKTKEQLIKKYCEDFRKEFYVQSDFKSLSPIMKGAAKDFYYSEIEPTVSIIIPMIVNDLYKDNE